MKFVLYFFMLLCNICANATDLIVKVDAKSDGNDKPTISGTTNLPDGIELMITIDRKGSDYMAQAKSTVSGGIFKAGPFSQKGQGLNPGTYNLEVMMPLAMMQPPNTWPIIGNEGAKLKGPLAKKSDIGGKIIEYKTSFKIGGGQASIQKDLEAKAESKKDKHAWWLKSCHDTCIISQGIAHKSKTKFDWDRCYYKCVADEP